MEKRNFLEKFCEQVQSFTQKGKEQMGDLAQKGREQVSTLAQKGKEQVDILMQKEREKKELQQLQKEFYEKVAIFLQRVNSCDRIKYTNSAIKLNQLCKTMDEVSSSDTPNMEELEQINRQTNDILNNLGIN